MAEPDLLFTVRNSFYLGAFQSAIAEASDLEGLSDLEKVERDCYVYRSYIELGSYEVRRSVRAWWSLVSPTPALLECCLGLQSQFQDINGML